MSEQLLVTSFGDSLTQDISSIVGEYVEIGIDSIMDEELLKEIPFVSTVASLYRIGNSFRERNYMKKLATFLKQINEGIADEMVRQQYREKFNDEQEFRKQELEYILILIDRYINFEKPQMLAKLYLAYLDKKLVWEEFTMYAEVIDRFLLLDYSTFMMRTDKFLVHRNIGCESILRLIALGLMMEVPDTSSFSKQEDGRSYLTWDTLTQPISSDKIYRRTEFGEKLAEILR